VNRARRTAALILLGAAVLALAVVVFVLNRDTSSDLLAVVAVLGGLAIVVVALPTNGNGAP
jgi:peptidoglycan/LPS O-acetylase OafA/YrhL